MKLLLLSALVALVVCGTLDDFKKEDLAEWELFKIEHQKEYKSKEEERARMKIFMGHLYFVREHNAKYESGEETFTVAINRFSDMTTNEVSELMKGYKPKPGHVRRGEEFKEPEDVILPDTVDWRKKGAVTPVKDQGRCGSCWAFSTTGTLEGHMFLKTKKLVSLSEQNLVDCSVDKVNHGCRGGEARHAFQYIMENKGIDTEASYPYEGHNGTCRYNSKDRGGEVTGYVEIPSGSEIKLQQAVAKGPVSVAIDAHHITFYHYHKGVLRIKDCSTTSLGHEVVAVGYGTLENGTAYWLLKNSWSTNWGMQGYVMLARNDDNMCGIATKASYPIV